MKNSLFTILGVLACIVALVIADRTAQAKPPGPPPNIKVILSLDKTTYYPGDPLTMNLALSNLGGDHIVRKNWSKWEVWFMLQFIDEKGRVITSDVIKESSTLTPQPPRVFPASGGVLVQGTLIEILPSGWFVSFDLDADIYYPMEGRTGNFRVRAAVPTITFLSYEQTAGGTKYASRDPIDTVKWYGVLESEFASFKRVGDADGDGYCYPEPCDDPGVVDCDDSDPSVHPGMTEQPGNSKDDDCNPATLDTDAECYIDLKADMHIVGSGSRPGSSKYPLEGLVVKVFDKSDNACAKVNYNFSWKNHESIFEYCPAVPLAGGNISQTCSGTCSLVVPPGDYLIIGEYDQDGIPIYIAAVSGELVLGETVEKYMQVIQKNDGKKVPGKNKILKGSELLIIEPEYVEWDGTQELYPFIFESIGTWTVTTAVNPPEGFVADNESITEQVKTELEAVQFTITDVGSEWTSTEVTHTVKHKKKEKKVKSKVHVKLSKKLAKKKGVDEYGNKIK